MCTSNIIWIDQGWGFAQHPSVTDAGEGCALLLLLQLLQGSGNGRMLLLPPGVTWDVAICIRGPCTLPAAEVKAMQVDVSGRPTFSRQFSCFMLFAFIPLFSESVSTYELFEPVPFLSKINQIILQLFHASCWKVLKNGFKWSLLLIELVWTQ